MPRHEVLILQGFDVLTYISQVVKRMWAYIKENNLQDPKNKQMIKCDDKLSKVSYIQLLYLGGLKECQETSGRNIYQLFISNVLLIKGVLDLSILFE